MGGDELEVEQRDWVSRAWASQQEQPKSDWIKLLWILKDSPSLSINIMSCLIKKVDGFSLVKM